MAVQRTDSEQRVSGTPRRRTYAWAAVAGFVAAGLAVLSDAVRLDHWTPFAQAIAFRPVLVVVLAIAGVGLMFVRRPAVRWAAASGLLACVLAAGSMAHRAVPDPGLEGATGTFTVATINVKGGSASVEEVAAVIVNSSADLVALPEAGEDFRLLLEAAVGDGYTGVSLQLSDEAVDAVSVLYRTDLGAVSAEASTAGSFPIWELSGGELGSLRFLAFHAYPPLPFAADSWRGDLQGLQGFCDRDTAIIAGDFNATLDHSALRTAMDGCTDAAASTGDGLHGTWPASAPGLLRTQIDHVFTTSGLQADSVEFTEIEGTDHLAVVAQIAVAP
ncbi:endonuclease/exonuclease/phosphatase family protein [Glycomyces tritici]|uniref:Endonuclease/exonuclease/phosphatase domain-containing protein n=1 Tax=Glycomyces tritici TaxID=2665176 RepID=A0ABT7YR29_9ACTN|nr:endonuclease/exonuclease/phosphatase family protein [Glycomyces tritici]MDN3241104.1 hypothetical protein [Glycomyces tritici]